MKNLILLLVFSLSIIFNGNTQSYKSQNTCTVMIYSDSIKINVFDSYLNGKIKCQIMNDTVAESYFVITIKEKRNGYYKIYASSLNSELEGWIKLDNLGINTRPRNGIIKLYDEPIISSKSISLNEVDERLVRVIDINKLWLKIEIISNGVLYRKWLPYKYQCYNPYSTCN